jgi:hypothetical protein
MYDGGDETHMMHHLTIAHGLAGEQRSPFAVEGATP